MGGGDLNLKKSWHPHTMKNQERVWKAEQAKQEEQRKLDDLRKEISEERGREELRRLGESSGVLASSNGGQAKLEWMYKNSAELINREEYLLGRKIDKSFEQLEAEERRQEQSAVGLKQSINHVEHECVPFSIREYRNLQSTEQVDMQRKTMEDPLMLIKQREMESRRKLLENPVKLKEIHRILKTEREQAAKLNKKSKKSKKSKKKKHKKGSSDDSDDDLDKKLARQMKKLKGEAGNQDEFKLDKLLDAKYRTLTKQLDMATKHKKGKKEHKKSKRRSESSEDSSGSSREEPEEPRGGRADSNSSVEEQRSRTEKEYRKGGITELSRESKEFRGRRDRSRSRERGERQRSRSVERGRRQRSRSTERGGRQRSKERERRQRSRSADARTKQEKNPRGRRDRSNSINQRRDREQKDDRAQREKVQSRRRSSRSRSPRRDRQRSPRRSQDRQRPERREQSRERKRRSPTPEKRTRRTPSPAANTRRAPPKSKPKLSEEEREARLREMMDNASWREADRTKVVQKHREEYAREEALHQARDFDQQFINKEVKKAIDNQTSIGNRIRSNLNNIQRTSAAMDSNFARK